MLGILELIIEKDLIKYTKLYKENKEYKLLYSGEKFFENDLEQIISEIINETNSINSQIDIKIKDFIKHDFKISAFLSKSDEKHAIEIEFNAFCSKNNINYKNYIYKYDLNIKEMEQGKKSITLYIVNREYINYIIESCRDKKLDSIKILSEDNFEIDFSEPEYSFKKLMTSEVSIENFSKFSSAFKYKTKKSFSREFSSVEKMLVRCIVCLIIFIFCYSLVSNLILRKINIEEKYLRNILVNSEKEIEKIDNDINKISDITQKYNMLLERKNAKSNSITNFLEKIIKFKGTDVDIISIELMQNNYVRVIVQSPKYEYLGELKKKIDENNILKDCSIKSTNKVNDLIEVILEGKLP